MLSPKGLHPKCRWGNQCCAVRNQRGAVDNKSRMSDRTLGINYLKDKIELVRQGGRIAGVLGRVRHLGTE